MTGAGGGPRGAATTVTAAEARGRLREALGALRRITGSQRLDRLIAERSGVPIGFAAVAVLGHVIESGPLRMSELAEVGRVHPAALTRQVQALEAEGYVARSVDPDDGRAWVVEATRSGRAAHQRVERVNDEIMAGQLDDWSADDLDRLADVLDRLITDLRADPTSRRRSEAS